LVSLLFIFYLYFYKNNNCYDNIFNKSQKRYIKQVVQLLEKSKIRKATGMAVVEGIHEIRNSLKAGLSIEKYFIRLRLLILKNVKKEINQDLDKIQVYECTPEVFKKISYRENSGGIVLVIKNPERIFNL
jgi:TrmH family RNA methyltransferase